MLEVCVIARLERRTSKHLQLKSSKESAMQKSKQSDLSVISGTSAVRQIMTIQVSKKFALMCQDSCKFLL